MYRQMFEHSAESSSDSERTAARRRWLDRDRELFEQVFARIPAEQRPPTDLVASGVWGTTHGLVSLIISGRMFGPLGRAIGVDEAKARAQGVVGGILVLPPDAPPA